MAENFLTDTELHQALVTDNSLMAPKTPAQKQGGLGSPELLAALDEQKFYESAVNNGLHGVEGTPTNDQIIKAYNAKKGLNTLMDAENIDWESVEAYENNFVDDLKRVSQAADNGDVDIFQQDQVMDDIDRETESGEQRVWEDAMGDSSELTGEVDDGYNIEDNPEMFDQYGNELQFDEELNEYVDTDGTVVILPDAEVNDSLFDDMTDEEQEELLASSIEIQQERAKRDRFLALQEKANGR